MTDSYRSDAEKDPRELEREVEQQRADIQDTLSALVQRFMPERVLEQVLDSVRHGGGELSRNLVDTVRANPLPAMLAAGGLAWMLFAGRKPQPAGGYAPATGYGRAADYSGASGADASSPASYGVDPAYDAHAGEGHHELGAESGHSAEGLPHVGEKARRVADHSRRRAASGVERMLREQPLAVGVIGLVLGALIGASIPGSRREDELLGPHKDRLARKASELADQATVKAEEVGRHIAEGVKESASKGRGKKTH